MTIGARIKSLRESRRMTLEEVAKLCKTTRQTIFKYENEIVTNIPYEKIELLSLAFQVSPSYLFGWEDSPATAYPAAQELNEQEAALIELFRALAPAEKDEAVEYLRYLKDRDELEQLRLDLQAALAAQKGAAER